MRDKDKTKELLLEEITRLRRRVAELERLEERRQGVEATEGLYRQALRQSEQRLRLALRNAPIIIAHSDRELRYTWVYNPYSEIPVEAMLGRRSDEIYPSEEMRTINQLKQHVLDTGETVRQEIYVGGGEGDERIYDMTVEPLWDDRGQIVGVASAAVDITTRKRAEERLQEYRDRLEELVRNRTAELERANMNLRREIARRRQTEVRLRASERRYRALFEHAYDAIHVANSRDEIIDANRRACEMMGYSREALLQMRVSDLQAPEVRGEPGSVVTGELARHGNVTFEALNQHRDGSRIPVEVTVSRVTDADGDLYMSIVRDISERKQAEEALRQRNESLEAALSELKATQQRVMQQERLAAVGQLAAGIAHDFNNLLTAIIGFAELIQLNPAVPDSARQDLKQIAKQGQRGAHLVRQILDFSRKSISQPQPLDLVPFCKEAVRFLQRTIPEHIQVTLDVSAHELMVRADSAQLQQALTNLALNAREAMPQGGRLALALSKIRVEPGQCSSLPDMPPGDWARLKIADTGVGIPASVLPHIFEPFFTTRETGQGAGLGLAQVYGIVQQHQGYLDVTSQTGQGTTFSLYLPLQTQLKPALTHSPAQPIKQGQGRTVLLVEDEPAVLNVARAILENLGYRVLTAVNGRKALELYASHRDRIDLVLTDMVMPDGNGLSLVTRLKADFPAVKVVVMSGYPMVGQEADEGLAQGAVDWLQKPLIFSQLAEVIGRALETAS